MSWWLAMWPSLGHAFHCEQVKRFSLQDRTVESQGEGGVPQVGVGEGTLLSLLSAGGLCLGTQDTPALAETRSDRAPPPRWQPWEAAGSLRKPLVDGKTTHWLSGGRFLAYSEEAPGGTQQATAHPLLPPLPALSLGSAGRGVGATSRLQERLSGFI